VSDVWTELVTSNPVHGHLKELDEATAEAIALDSLPEPSITYLLRIAAVLANIQERLRQVPPVLIPATSLTNGDAQVQYALGFVRNFISDQNLGHLQNANGHIDNLLIEFRWLLPLTARRESQVVQKSAERLAATVDGFEVNIRRRLDALVQEIATANAETLSNLQTTNSNLESIRSAAETSVTNLSAKLDAATAALTGEITSQKSRLDTYFEQQQAAYLTTQQERQREFSELLETLRQANRAEIDAQTTIMQANAKRFGDEGDQLIASLGSLEQQAKEITGVTAAAGVTGAYIKEAEEQRTEADTWRRWASILLVVTVLSAVATTFWSPLNGNVSTEEILEYGVTRVPIVVIVGTVTTYAATQSAHHRTRERNAKRRALELTAFRPFIGELPTADQHELIKETTRKYFRGDDDSSPPSVRTPG